MDVCRPMQVTSVGGSRYTATFLDDATGLSCVMPCATKAGVPGIVKSTLTMLENQSVLRISSVRSWTCKTLQGMQVQVQGLA
jgi:hypothetical protein